MPTNRLIHEKSPYLLQHAHNPVDWFPWGEEAFSKARAEDKPIFLSAGYSTCHWCHVMERESFEDEQAAAILNRHFVSIKLDREERPDVDRVYMLFVQATTGGGGWPLSVWLTPDLKPFFGGTYFPPDSRYGRPGFAALLEQIAAAWRTRREELATSGERVLAALARNTQAASTSAPPDEQSLERAYFHYRRLFDPRHGGFGEAPKFPRPTVFNFLFRYWRRTGEAEALEMALHTLREMARGGMYDHLGGGFHRYSVDERWRVPHFEKMLYDQAQLAVSCLEAFQIAGEQTFAGVARETLDYVLRDMTHPEGAFYSAEDADSALDPSRPHDKTEGAFYTWPLAELSALLGPARAAAFAAAYGCLEDGNAGHDPHGEFTGRNILYQAGPAAGLDECRAILLEARARRPRPHLDDKILASWNGLMISAFAKGAAVLSSPRYLDAARRASAFVFGRLFDPAANTLWRRWREGEPAVPGMLDDYAFLAQSQIDLYEASGEADCLDRALNLTRVMIERFEDPREGGFFSTAHGASGELVLRLKDDYDGAEPSGNPVAVTNLLRLAQYTGESGLREAAGRALAAFAPRLDREPAALPQLLCALLLESAPKREVVLAGPDPAPFLGAFWSGFHPWTAIFHLPGDSARHRLAAWRPAAAAMTPVDGQTTAYVCEDFACRPPAVSVEEFSGLLQSV
jgi:uncharacterized protein YyaL (SSP411 family)